MTTNQTDPGNPFIKTRETAELSADDQQDLNQNWWQTLPMTYADWDGEDRLPKDAEDLLKIEQYVLETGPWLKTWFEAKNLDGLRCLDLGSGSGIFSTMLSRRGGDITAMDLTQAGVELTSHSSEYFKSGVDVVRGDAENNPFATGRFDFVYSWGVLHHTSNMNAAVKEMGRIIKPGGGGIMMVYYKYSVVYYVHGLFWLIIRGKVFQGHSCESVQDFYTDGYYHRYLSKRELEQTLNEAGLEVTRFIVTQYKKKILPFIPAWLDLYLKKKFGMCLVAEFTKAPS